MGPQLLQEILEVSASLHSAGAMHPAALGTLAALSQQRDVLTSVETGCGASTLVMSHCSKRHIVFAKDAGNGSVSNVRASPLLRSSICEFIDGATQKTLPAYRFSEPIQCALLDGPHAFPFPQLEYYFVYPQLETGALLVLVLDDIQIPTVRQLYEFIRADPMFRLTLRCGTTAFFERTAAPTFDPFGDGWSQQPQNRTILPRYRWRDAIRALVPTRLEAMARRAISNARSARCGSVTILEPQAGAAVAATECVAGQTSGLSDGFVWVLVRRNDQPFWWLQGFEPVDSKQPLWRIEARFGEDVDVGHAFEIRALVVGEAIHRTWTSRLEQPHSDGTVRPPAKDYVFAQDLATARRR